MRLKRPVAGEFVLLHSGKSREAGKLRLHIDRQNLKCVYLPFCICLSLELGENARVCATRAARVRARALRRCPLFSRQTGSALAHSLLQTSPRFGGHSFRRAIDDNDICEINGNRVNRMVGDGGGMLKYYVAGIKVIAPPTVAISSSNRRALQRTRD